MILIIRISWSRQLESYCTMYILWIFSALTCVPYNIMCLTLGEKCFVYDNDNHNHIERCKSRFLRSPHCAANSLQHVPSSGPGAIKCKSLATHRALIITCCVPLGTKGQLSYYVWQSRNRIDFSFILLAETVNRCFFILAWNQNKALLTQSSAPDNSGQYMCCCCYWSNHHSLTAYLMKMWTNNLHKLMWPIIQSTLLFQFFYQISTKIL